MRPPSYRGYGWGPLKILMPWPNMETFDPLSREHIKTQAAVFIASITVSLLVASLFFLSVMRPLIKQGEPLPVEMQWAPEARVEDKPVFIPPKIEEHEPAEKAAEEPVKPEKPEAVKMEEPAPEAAPPPPAPEKVEIKRPERPEEKLPPPEIKKPDIRRPRQRELLESNRAGADISRPERQRESFESASSAQAPIRRPLNRSSALEDEFDDAYIGGPPPAGEQTEGGERITLPSRRARRSESPAGLGGGSRDSKIELNRLNSYEDIPTEGAPAPSADDGRMRRSASPESPALGGGGAGGATIARPSEKSSPGGGGGSYAGGGSGSGVDIARRGGGAEAEGDSEAASSGGDGAGEVSIKGVALENLAACQDPLRERRLKAQILKHLGARKSCRSPSGLYHFYRSRRVETLGVAVEGTGGRTLGDRCQELKNAYDCLR